MRVCNSKDKEIQSYIIRCYYDFTNSINYMYLKESLHQYNKMSKLFHQYVICRKCTNFEGLNFCVF